MGRVRVSARIKAPLEEVFKYIADGENAPDWHPSIEEAKRIMDTRLGVGSTVRYKAKVGPLELVWITRAVEFEWNKGFKDVLVGVEKGPLKSYELRGRFESLDDGTLVELELEYSLSWGPIGWIIDKLLVERRVKRHMQEGLERAKHKLEVRGS